MSRLDNAALQQSPVVANNAMNRERGCVGDNSYAKELGLNPVEFLKQRLDPGRMVAWLDLCCGSARALIEAASLLEPAAEAASAELSLIGVDLVGMFDRCPPELRCVRLEQASVADWEPTETFDLVTCVHGLHYVGDKLQFIERAVSWLKDDGQFLAHLDPRNLRHEDGNPAGRNPILDALRRQGVEYHRGRHLLVCHGPKQLALNYRYVGADDQAGPNYTKQPAVDSHYR